MSTKSAENNFIDLENSPSLKNWGEPAPLPLENVIVECGWGRLIFGHTFRDNTAIAKVLGDEKDRTRDIALYLRDPQVVISEAPQHLFIDPSYTFRLFLDQFTPIKKEQGAFTIRLANLKQDLDDINRIYNSRKMVPVDIDMFESSGHCDSIKYWVAVDDDTDAIIATAMGIDHKLAMDDPEDGSSLWCLAVDPQATHPGVGLHLLQHVLNYYQGEGRRFTDLSVLHSNAQAIELYKKLGFVQIPVFCIKNKNAINETLFSGTEIEEGLSHTSMLIVNEARRRGIRVDVLDTVDNYYRLSFGGTGITCRESLSELTSSIAMSRCTDKSTTTRLLKNAGLNVPDQHVASKPYENQSFLQKYGCVVVKPSYGEKGAGITIDIKTKNELANAIDSARQVGNKVLLEQMVNGQDLRIIVINNDVVAAAVRKPPVIIGDGKLTVYELVQKQSRRREHASHGESRIPIDHELRRTVQNEGLTLDDVLSKGQEVQVRKSVNYHFGGTIHDVTDELHPELIRVAKKAARILDLPVTGLDLIVESPKHNKYVILAANERPQLANYDARPLAESFINFLFPQSIARDA